MLYRVIVLLALSFPLSQRASAVSGSAASQPDGKSGGQVGTVEFQSDLDLGRFDNSSRFKSSKFSERRIRIFDQLTDPDSADLSVDAVQLAETLNLAAKLRELNSLRQKVEGAAISGQKAPADLRLDYLELKADVISQIEQTRLEIDFVSSEIDKETAGLDEVLRSFNDEASRRMNQSNLWSFRTNGVLWALAEAFSIPTYRNPRLAIPSGTVGIVAGVIPSLFSLYSVKAPAKISLGTTGLPNMLSKIYGLPVHPQIQYPTSVWAYFNASPPGEKRSRRELLIQRWIDNKNMKTLEGGLRKESLLDLSGARASRLNAELLQDRLYMLREVKAMTLQMNRPLLELSQLLNGKKNIGTL